MRIMWLTASGRVFAFGNNFNGELGLGHRRGCAFPAEIESLRGCRIAKVISVGIGSSERSRGQQNLMLALALRYGRCV